MGYFKISDSSCNRLICLNSPCSTCIWVSSQSPLCTDSTTEKGMGIYLVLYPLNKPIHFFLQNFSLLLAGFLQKHSRIADGCFFFIETFFKRLCWQECDLTKTSKIQLSDNLFCFLCIFLLLFCVFFIYLFMNQTFPPGMRMNLGMDVYKVFFTLCGVFSQNCRWAFIAIGSYTGQV